MDDLISRRDVLDVIDKYILGKEEDETCEVRELLRLITKIYHMPSAEPKTGKWIKVYGFSTPGGDPVWRCSECGKGLHAYGIEASTYGADIAGHQWVSCPNCGADMRQRKEEHDESE